MTTSTSSTTIEFATLAARRAARKLAGAHASMPVVIVDGAAPPTIRGRSYYWTTLSGKTIVRYPNAYRWPTWYHHSTLRVVVGRDSLFGRAWLSTEARALDGLRALAA